MTCDEAKRQFNQGLELWVVCSDETLKCFTSMSNTIKSANPISCIIGEGTNFYIVRTDSIYPTRLDALRVLTDNLAAECNGLTTVV